MIAAEIKFKLNKKKAIGHFEVLAHLAFDFGIVALVPNNAVQLCPRVCHLHSSSSLAHSHLRVAPQHPQKTHDVHTKYLLILFFDF